ncbi:hypothetical protein P7H06_15640 [Paenibacillus larvae]|nr:hypothetical protein [Paenibacillus larvae]MDT2260653.1 hypothetical protein [Paenibacillus larvae]
MIDNLYGSIEIFKSGVSEVAIKLDRTAPSIRKGVDALTKFVEGLGKIDQNKVEIFVRLPVLRSEFSRLQGPLLN